MKKSIREGATVLLTVALLMGLTRKRFSAFSMMEYGEYRTAKAWTVPTATTYDLHMYAWNKMNVDTARYSCSIPVEGMKNFKERWVLQRGGCNADAEQCQYERTIQM